MYHEKKGVMYSMDFAVCDDMYIGETDRPVRVRFARHYRNFKAMEVRTAWGSHYVDHSESATLPNFAPFCRAQILRRHTSLPSRRLMEATEIAQYSQAVNRDGGWRLLV